MFGGGQKKKKNTLNKLENLICPAARAEQMNQKSSLSVFKQNS